MKLGTVPRIAGIVWLIALIVLFAPVAALWALKLGAALAGCVPGPASCTSYPLGQWFNTMLDVAGNMIVGGGLFLAIAMAAAGIATGNAWRAVGGVAAPFLALIFTGVTAITTASFQGCVLIPGRATGCTLWGEDLDASLATWTMTHRLVILGLPIALVAAAIVGTAATFARRRRGANPISR